MAHDWRNSLTYFSWHRLFTMSVDISHMLAVGPCSKLVALVNIQLIRQTYREQWEAQWPHG